MSEQTATSLPAGSTAETDRRAAAQRPRRVVHVAKDARRGNASVHVAVDPACAQADRGVEVWFGAARHSYGAVLRDHGVTGVDLPEATGLARNRGGRHLQPSVAVVSGLHRRQGVDRVIEAFSMVSQDCPVWHLTVVGWVSAQEERPMAVASESLATTSEEVSAVLRR